MSRNNDNWAVANLLVGRYGPDAASEARQRAALADDAGERDVAEIWSSVHEALGVGEPDRQGVRQPRTVRES
jgi:hypothetical protein